MLLACFTNSNVFEQSRGLVVWHFLDNVKVCDYSGHLERVFDRLPFKLGSQAPERLVDSACHDSDKKVYEIVSQGILSTQEFCRDSHPYFSQVSGLGGVAQLLESVWEQSISTVFIEFAALIPWSQLTKNTSVRISMIDLTSLT